MADSKQSVGVKFTGDEKDLKRSLQESSKSIADFKRQAKQHANEVEQNFKQVTIAIAKIAGGVIIAKESFAVFSKVMGSTQGSAMKLDEVMQGAGLATQKFFQMIATGDFSNFIGNLGKAAKAGAEYAEALRQIDERRLGLSLEQTEAEFKQNELIREARDNTLSATERQKALNEYKSIAVKLAKEGVEVENQAVIDYSKKLAAIGIETGKIKELYETYNSSIKEIKDAEEKVLTIQKLRTNYEIALANWKESGSVREGDNADRLKKKMDDYYNSMTDEEKHYADLLATNDKIKKGDLVNFITLLKQQAHSEGEISNIDRETQRIQNSIHTAMKGQVKSAETLLKLQKEINNTLSTGYKLAPLPTKGVTTPTAKEPYINVGTALSAPLAANIASIDTTKLVDESGIIKMNEAIAKNMIEQRDWVKFISDSANAFRDLGSAISSASSSSQSDFVKAMNIISETAKMAIAVYEALACAGMISKESNKGIIGLITAAAGVAAIIAMFAEFATPKKMSEGGIAYGSTLANVGEYAGANTNPEVIAPLSKLKGLLGGQLLVRVEGKFNGRDIYFATAEYARMLSLNT